MTLSTDANFKRFHRPASAGEKSQARKYQRGFTVALLIVLLFVTQKFWYYRVSGVVLAEDNFSAQGAVYLRYFCWLMVLVGHAVAFTNGNAISNQRANAWMYGVMVYGLAMAFIGGRPSDSFQGIIMEAIVMSGAVLVAAQLPSITVLKYTLAVLCIQVLISIAIVLGDPGSGIIGEASRVSWRGGFLFKLGLGVTCAYSLLLLYISKFYLNKFLILCLTCILLVTLVKSDSAGSLVAAVIAIMHFEFTRLLARLNVSRGAWYVIVSVVYFSLIFLAILSTTFVLDLLGRDFTLTGRTDIWALYAPKVFQHWALGAGPGAFSGPSEYTLPYVEYWPWLGKITQPHNTYLQMIGDVGVFGMLFYFVFLLRLIFVLPNSDRSIMASTISSLAFLLVITGSIETLSPFSLNSAVFFIVLFYSSYLLQRPRSTQ